MKIKWGILGTANIARYATIPGRKKAEHTELYAIAGRNAKPLALKDKVFKEIGY